MPRLHSIWGSGLGFLCAIWRLVGPEEAAEMLKIFKVKMFLCHSCFSWSNVCLEPHIPTISFSTTSTSLNSLVEGARGVSSPWDEMGLRYGQTQPWAPLPSPPPPCGILWSRWVSEGFGCYSNVSEAGRESFAFVSLGTCLAFPREERKRWKVWVS